MKLRHAAALALVGWYLTIGFGKTYEKGCLSCGVDLGQGFGFGGPPFATKAKCEQAGNKEVRAFYAEAKKNGERVAFPTTFKCVEKHDSKPATPLLKLGH